MNLTKLFATQKLLDARIVDEHKLHGQDLLPQKILALQVELGELANEWRGFKFWSYNQEARTRVITGNIIVQSDGYELEDYKNPLLEEYVDGLHFILSIGNELNYEIDEINMDSYIKFESITEQFIETFKFILWIEYEKDNEDHYYELLKLFLGLGEMLGFTHDQIEQAYYAKNKINHDRQDGGY